MSPMITYLLMFFLVAYALFILIELILNRGWKRFAIQGIVLAGVILILRWTTGFPAMKIAFGGTSPITAVLLMFVCTLVGIAANYFYSLEGEFSWTIFLKPLVLSPIVLLPLLGSIHKSSDLDAVQIISFGFLAFQNGFFWREVVKYAKPKTK